MLETEIKNLTAQIEKLNSNFEALFNNWVPTQKTSNGEDSGIGCVPKKEETKPTITRDYLRELCISKVRGNSTNKTKVKDILKNKGASLVDDLKEEDLEEVQKLLGAL